MSIAENIEKYTEELGQNVALVAVSKTKPNEALLEAYEAGQRIFGENKVQEMVAKWESLPKDIEWHMIGHVQTNKIKYMAPFVHLVHGVDRFKVLKELDKQALKAGRVIDCLLQVHIAKEDTQWGFDPSERRELTSQLGTLEHVRVRGLMGMSTNTSDMNLVEQEFRGLRELFDEFAQDLDWDILSMGMSGDYKSAIRAGSTHVRIGSAIFGARNYAH
jgi:pyridoxal phosphate enzyme (YggS family)